ncbi:MAG: hypothetical protein SVQ76_02715 [Candidatus Nanohaloarchaea archaeon]|nr:hypothetical protein [Candidatus Nanohaloarchaea archaeon]
MEENLEKALQEEGVTLVISEAGEYHGTNREIVDYLVNDQGLTGIYATVNEPYRTVERFLQEGGIDTGEVFFVDAISKDVGAEEPEKDNLMFLESPQHLTDISIVLSETIEKMPDGEKFVFFDSLSTLTIYNSVNTVSKFAHFLTGKMRNWNVRGIVISVEAEADEQLISRMRQFADRTVEI